jgi:hypothetical protein
MIALIFFVLALVGRSPAASQSNGALSFLQRVSLTAPVRLDSI